MNNKLKALSIYALIKLIDNLNWDYDRMSSSGKETMDKINEIIKEIENE